VHRRARPQDPKHDVGIYDKTPCQQKLVDYVHRDLVAVNSLAYRTFSFLVVVIMVNRNVAKQFVENDDPPDPFTKLIVAFLLVLAGVYALRLMFSAALQWVYSYTSIMFVFVGLGCVPVIGTAWWVVWREKKRLFGLTNALLIAIEMCLFIAAVFGGFFTGDLQSISEMYHENWDIIGDDIERAFPGICEGLDTNPPDPLRTECKAKLKDLTLDQLQTAVNGLLFLSVVIIVIVFLTWRAVINLSEQIYGMHGLSQFDLETIEKVVYLRREEIIGAADLYWQILHHPHRPINATLINTKDKKAHKNSDIDVGKLESQLREAERVRIKSLTPATLESECMKFGLHPTGSVQTLRRRLLQNYSSRRMAQASQTSKADVEHAKQHFFELGEPELRLIPALAFCPFLDRLLEVFSEDGSGFLHFEEFLNLYSVFSSSCPIETKIRYAWCIYDLNATGDIGLDEVQALVMQLLGLSKHDLVSDSHKEVEAETHTTENPIAGADSADLSQRVKGGNAEEAARIDSLWSQMDLDGSGMLEEPEFRGVLECMGTEFSEEKKFAKIWKELDKDQDGGVSQEEFIRWWTKQKKSMRGTFEQQLAASTTARAEDVGDLDELEALGIAEPQPEPEPEPEQQGAPGSHKKGRKARTRDEETERLASLWHEMDLDGSGMLDFEELKLVVEKMNPKMSEKKKKKILSQLDDDNDGCLTQTEFMKWWMSQKAEVRDLIAGEDMPEQPKPTEELAKLVRNPLQLAQSMGNILAPTEAQLEKARQRRAQLRQEKFTLAEQKRLREKEQTEKDVRGLMELLMKEVDEDEDGVLNFHEFRKGLLQAPQFQENFQLPFPDPKDLLIYPQAEEASSNSDDVLLTPEEHKELMRFSTGHRRRRKSLTQEEIDQARAAQLERESRSGRRRSSKQGGSPRSPSDVSRAAKDAVDTALVQPAVKVAKKAKKVVKKVDPEVEARRKAKWTKFNMRQEERQKMLRKHNQKLGDLVNPNGSQSMKRNPHQFRSIYSQLIAQRQLEIREEMRRIKHLKQKKKERERQEKERKKLEKEAKKHGLPTPADSPSSPDYTPTTPGSPLDLAQNLEQGVIDVIGIDWNTFDVADMESSLAFRSVRAMTEAWLSVVYGILEAIESVQNQDKIPFWVKDVQKVEGDFGAGVASVFSLKRWLFSINAYMAAAWVCFVIMPYLIIKDSDLGQESIGLESLSNLNVDTFLQSRDDMDQSSGSAAEDRMGNMSTLDEGYKPPPLDQLSGPAWLYYSSYPSQLGSYRLDFAYLMTVIVLFIMNIMGVIRNIAYTIALQFQNQIHDDEHTYEATSLLFAGYDFRSCLRSIVEQNQRQIRNNLKALLMKERAKEYSSSVGLKGRLRRAIGFLLCTALAALMGGGIVWTLQNSAALQANRLGIPNATNNIITLIKILIPKL
jgi:Ca2+-binding EF-hand superfamily protein